jgi:hypothetical protein
MKTEERFEESLGKIAGYKPPKKQKIKKAAGQVTAWPAP